MPAVQWNSCTGIMLIHAPTEWCDYGARHAAAAAEMRFMLHCTLAPKRMACRSTTVAGGRCAPVQVSMQIGAGCTACCHPVKHSGCWRQALLTAHHDWLSICSVAAKVQFTFGQVCGEVAGMHFGDFHLMTKVDVIFQLGTRSGGARCTHHLPLHNTSNPVYGVRHVLAITWSTHGATACRGRQSQDACLCNAFACTAQKP